jgi:hypothetical protein
VLAPILYEFLESKGEIKLEFDQLLTYAVTHVPREMLTPIRMKRVAGKGTSYKVEQKAPRGIADDDL